MNQTGHIERQINEKKTLHSQYPIKEPRMELLDFCTSVPGQRW